MTLFAERPIILSVFILIPTALLLFVPRREGGPSLPSSQPPSLAVSAPKQPSRTWIRPLPALTTYRAHMMLMTILAILAVDFPVFPRSLAKCETYGVSLMDLGVGSFVFSQGIISAIPLIKDPSYLTSSLPSKLFKVIRKSLPVIFLGLVRVLLVKGTEYPEHETEYGRHWNFFITLALVPILQVLLHPIIIYLPVSLLGVLIAVGQQSALSHFALESYILTAPRTSIISANKEGIVSLPGYLAIHLLGLSAGTLVLPPSPSFFRRRQQGLADKLTKRRISDAGLKPDKDLDLAGPRQTGKTANELCSYSIVWWGFLGLTKLANFKGQWGGVSRRMANLPYILWVAAFNTSFLLAYLVVLDISFFPGPKPKKKEKPLDLISMSGRASPYVTSSQQPPVDEAVEQGNPPQLLEAINNHGLVLFLLANVLTGAINLKVETMYASDAWAMCILSVYSLVVCAVAWVWSAREKRKP
ncbi:hypothetical protein K443DRAFT_686228 [Laccaria amethystina LaAM-08-1]|uniref:GPI-anchored wall transfer protein n=1 Tax=Laccaria amethystina LaAM-08-1 TaxID=1095629 RepID=A0A0C9WSV8_9AGAR|nr:hypothetical protein K443DRAFT_686228 [Laccaria amethystina LaAM-08-1]